MWIKKNNTLINLEKFDVIMQDSNEPDLIMLVTEGRKIGLGFFNQTSKIIDEIAKLVSNGESVYVLPCEKK